jgi:hypothetical protein
VQGGKGRRGRAAAGDQARRQRIGAAAANPVASVRCAKGL